MPYYNCGALCLGICSNKRIVDSHRISAVDVNHIPSPRAIFHGHILGVYGIDIGRQLHLVAVIKHYQVAQPEITGDTPCALRDFLLDAPVRNERICLVADNIAETCLQEPLSDCAPHSHRMALPQRTGGVFNPPLNVDFGMPGANAPPLAELLKFFNRVFACEGKHGI